MRATPRPPSRTHDDVADEFSSLLECDGFGISGIDAMNHKPRHTVAAQSNHQAELKTFWVTTLKYLIGVADFDRMFASMDLDGSGTLDLGELRAALQRADPSVTEVQVQARMDALDADGDGSSPRRSLQGPCSGTRTWKQTKSARSSRDSTATSSSTHSRGSCST